MARIRTIKPEFPHSESMGRVSRDARLLFIQLWTLADDVGRLRGNSRILASLLYPYDDDATDLIDSWLTELEAEECIVRYVVDRATYLQLVNWGKHQKVDKPTASKLPSFEEGSRILANPREPSSVGGSPPREDSSGDLDLDLEEGMDLDLDLPSASSTPRDAKAGRRKTNGHADPPEFLQLQTVYPKRAGDQGWRKALRACHARLTEGHTWAEIIAGAERYAEFCTSTQKAGTEYVKQAATFVGPDKHFLAKWPAPPTKADQRLNSNLSAAEEFMRRTEKPQ